jgi:hypothetical protein
VLILGDDGSPAESHSLCNISLEQEVRLGHKWKSRMHSLWCVWIDVVIFTSTLHPRQPSTYAHVIPGHHLGKIPPSRPFTHTLEVKAKTSSALRCLTMTGVESGHPIDSKQVRYNKLA